MGRQDEQPGIAHAYEGHQHEVGGMIVRKLAFLLDQFITITDCGFITMVTISNEDGLVVEERLDVSIERSIIDRPDLADDTQVIVCFGGKNSRDSGIELVLNRAVRVWIKPKDRAEVSVYSLHQAEAIFLGAGESLFVRVDFAFAEAFETNPCEDTLAGVGLAINFVLLMQHIDRRLPFGANHLLQLHLLPEAAGTEVLFSFRLACFCLGEFETDDIVRMLIVEFLLQHAIDDIVRRSDDAAEVAHATEVVSDPGERFYHSHVVRFLTEWRYDMADLVEVSRRLRENVERLEERIASACQRAGRARGEVQLVPITKYVDAEITGLLHEIVAVPLGESRPQVIWEKAPLLPNATWHLVGHLQRNKVARTLPLVSLIHSVDSQRLLLAIDEEAKKLGKTQDVLLELHLTQESTKSGFGEDEWDKIPEYVSSLQNVRVLGLMGMAALESTPEEARITFAKLRSLRDTWLGRFAEPYQLQHLSMGMTHDFEQAIEEGATLIRVGSALFDGII